jgi:hypothetical protein
MPDDPRTPEERTPASRSWKWRFEGAQEEGGPGGEASGIGFIDAPGEAWHRLQIHHTPFRATEQREYWRLSEALRRIERIFLEHPGLLAYYRECFAPEWTEPDAVSAVEGLESGPIVGIQAQFMEDVFYALQLERHANAPDNRGWMNLFRRWGRSSTFNLQLDRMRATFALDFLEFYDLYLRYLGERIDEFPVPHPWDAEPRRRDPRPAARQPPLRTGGEPDRGSRSAEPPRPDPDPSTQPQPGHLPGLYLDPGIREAKRAGERSGERPQETPRQSSSDA